MPSPRGPSKPFRTLTLGSPCSSTVKLTDCAFYRRSTGEEISLRSAVSSFASPPKPSFLRQTFWEDPFAALLGLLGNIYAPKYLVQTSERRIP